MFTISGFINPGTSFEDVIHFDGDFSDEQAMRVTFYQAGCTSGHIYDNVGLAGTWSISAGFQWI